MFYKYRYYTKTLLGWSKSEWWSDIRKLCLDEYDSVFADLYQQVEENRLETEDNNICTIVVDKLRNKPIAIAMYNEISYSKISYMTFVSKEYRRQKIGSRLFKRVKKETKARTIVTWPHDYQSNEFFYSVRPNYFLDEI